MLLTSFSILLLFTPSTQASSSLPSIIFLFILLLVLCVPYPSLPSTPFSISPTFNFLHGRPVSRNSIKMTTSEAASEADSAMSQVNTFFHIRPKCFWQELGMYPHFTLYSTQGSQELYRSTSKHLKSLVQKRFSMKTSVLLSQSELVDHTSTTPLVVVICSFSSQQCCHLQI